MNTPRYGKMLFIIIMLSLISLACSLPALGQIQPDNSEPTFEAAYTVVAGLPSPAAATAVSGGSLEANDSLVGEWQIFTVNTRFNSPSSIEEAQTWLGDVAQISPAGITYHGVFCLLGSLERSNLPSDYSERIGLNLNDFGIPESGAQWVETSCAGLPFASFIQLNENTLVLQNQGSLLWLQKLAAESPKRPLVYSKLFLIKEDDFRSISIQIPSLAGDFPNAQSYNTAVYELHTPWLTQFIQDTSTWALPPEPVTTFSDLSMDYKVHWNDGQRISILTSVYSYYAGAAHPNLNYLTINYDLNLSDTLLVNEVFVSGSDYLTFLHDHCAASLDARGIGYWEEGLTLDPITFHNFTFTQKGLAIHFDPYQVAPYAAGPQTVLIPYTDLNGWLKPEYIPTLP